MFEFNEVVDLNFINSDMVELKENDIIAVKSLMNIIKIENWLQTILHFIKFQYDKINNKFIVNIN